MKSMSITPIQTEVFTSGDLVSFIQKSIPSELIHEKMIVAITSKIVSLAEARVRSKASFEKIELIKKEADLFLGDMGYGAFLTIKHGLLIPSAGIDESNSANGDYILYPKDPFLSAQRIWSGLKDCWGLDELGIVITDSHSSPLRRGVTGICLSYWGFKGLRNLIGTPDLFGREMKMTQMNLADGLASTAVLVMGESNERKPLAVLNGYELEFCDQIDPDEIRTSIEEDLYLPLLRKLTPSAK